MEIEATSRRNARSARRSSFGAVLTLAALFGALPLAQAGWDGSVDIQLGESFAAAFNQAPGIEVHRYYFYAPANTLLGATWKTSFGKLVPVVAVYKADGTLIPLGATLNAKTNTIKNLVLPTSADYYIQVMAASNTGEYTIKTTAKFPTSFTFALPAAGAAPAFEALGGSLLAAKVAKAAKNSTAVPSFNSLTGPTGAVVLPPAPAVKPPKVAVLASFSKVSLPASGSYVLGVEYKSGVGGVVVGVTVTPPSARHVWYLGPMDPPTVSLSRDNAAIKEIGGVATFTATLSAVCGLPVTVDLAFSGTATLNADYTRSATQIVIPAGSTSGSITVTAVQDALKEADETVIVDIAAVTNSTENGVQQQTTTILDDDAVPQVDLWQGSAHADASSEAFRHWDSAGAVERGCARCHSRDGYRDFIGDDGTPDNRFDHPAAVNGVFPQAMADGPAPLGSTIDCNACHNETAAALDAVVFPSDRPAIPASGTAPAKPARPAVAMDLGPEARCMQCHQGRESTISVDEYIASKSPVSDDTITAGLGFRNVHYLGAAATLYGGGARGAYQYRDGQTDAHLYDGLNPHVPEANTCVKCHNPHSLEVEIALCAQCHVNAAKNAVATEADLKDIRMVGSTEDYDGDGNVTEGMYYELQHMAATLLTAIKAYGTLKGAPIDYNANAYPYFIKAGGGTYTSWTPRLLRAAYNYNYYVKEPGTFAHNPKYMVEILYDSIEDLIAGGVAVANFAAMHRSDIGHFDGQSMAFRDWDAAGATNDIDRGDVSVSCSPCHSNGGFNFWQTYGLNTTVAMPAADGFECGTCHVGGDFAADTPALKVVKTVLFPSPVASPVTITNSTTAPDTSFICMSCHRGRESMATLDADIASRAAAGQAPRFRNIHYLAAGASIYGKDAKVAYMFGPAASYSGKWTHNGGSSAQCKYCHVQRPTAAEAAAHAPDKSHTFQARLTSNCLCHSEAGDDIEAIRLQRPDYNGVAGDTLKQEVQSFAAALFAQMQVYAAANGLDPIIYDISTNPYFFKAPGVTYTTWNPTLVRAAFNYQYSQKEPGAWAHNTKFVLQVLYDSIDMLNDGVLNGNVPVLTRPAAAK